MELRRADCSGPYAGADLSTRLPTRSPSQDSRIDVIAEPKPLPEARDLFPEDYEILATAPNFLFFVLHAA